LIGRLSSPMIWHSIIGCPLPSLQRFYCGSSIGYIIIGLPFSMIGIPFGAFIGIGAGYMATWP
jgi:hypothetical protein